MGFLIGTPFSKNAGWSHYRYSCETRVVEDDVQTCPHCQAVIRMRQWGETKNGKMAGGYCSKCDKPTCGHKDCLECVPFLKRLEKHFDMTVKYAQFVKDAGLEPAKPHQPIITGV